ncbi:MAG: MFS transporter, partial [Desulfobacterota bacterium]|nr:MFS transporter [Thermodesulfobacteriota bacterium]
MSKAWGVFFLASANFFLSQFYRSTNAVIAPQLLTDLSLSTEDLGLLSAAFFYAFGLAQIPITVLLDRVGARRMM